MLTDTTSPSYRHYRIIYCGSTVSVKGVYDITSYDEDIIILKCASDVVCISGANLFIVSMDADGIYIRGNIDNISFS